MKSSEFREQVFLTVFDRDGKRICKQAAYGGRHGDISLEMPKRMPLSSGYLVQRPFCGDISLEMPKRMPPGPAAIRAECRDRLARDVMGF